MAATAEITSTGLQPERKTSMSKLQDDNNPGLQVGSRHGRFTVERVLPVEPIQAFFYALVHEDTGARYVHVSRPDRENTFSVAFKTVPQDSTGVAHILEHTVLCGSRRYPVRDPFFSMLKRSLSTFMNAFTASDWTMYPFSTQNRKDFYNLMSVYLDAAFYPRLNELAFKQEGHRLEFEQAEDGGRRLTYKGVVYNEMKGAMSSPDQVMVRSLMNALYPDTTYRFNSGGDPEAIPSLTYEQLKAFHRRHYHPSNAFFYTYGDLPLTEHLDFIQEQVLDHFERIDPGTEVPSQPRWDKPRTAEYAYPLDRSEDAGKKYQACVAWLTADITDAFEVLVLTILEQVLMGNPASPLRRALIDSQLGSALCDGAGFDADNRDAMFVAGLKDVARGDDAKVESIVFDVLHKQVEQGVDPRLVEAAIHQIEFHRREVTNTPYPYGLKLMLAFSGPWFHGGDPVAILRFDKDLKRLRGELGRGKFLEAKIRQYFLDNAHRVRFTLVPDHELEEKQSRRVRTDLEKLQKQLTPEEAARITEDARRLKALQETHEDVSVLPTLEIADIPPDVIVVEPSAPYGPLAAEYYAQPTSGIFYFSAAAGCGNLEARLLPMVPFFCHALTQVGTRRRDYTEMARLIDTYTGGIGSAPQARTRPDVTGACVPFVTLSGKCLVRNQARMFDIITELAGQFSFEDTERLKNLLLEYRAALESMVVHNGHQLAISLASRTFSATAALSENWQGIHQLHFIKGITDGLSAATLAALSADLAAIAETVFARDNLKIALIGEDEALKQGADLGAALMAALARGAGGGFETAAVTPEPGLPREGWTTSSAVSFVAETFPVVRLDHPDSAVLAVISKLLRSLYLHREIREKGGAYGGFALYSPEAGIFSLASYRDPHIVATLNVYRGASDFLLSDSFEDEDIKEAVLQVCSEIDKPDPPGPAARKAFYRRIVGISDEMRRRFKQNLLGITRQQVRQAARTYFARGQGSHAVAVISGPEQLEEANRHLKSRPLKVAHI